MLNRPKVGSRDPVGVHNTRRHGHRSTLGAYDRMVSAVSGGGVAIPVRTLKRGQGPPGVSTWAILCYAYRP